MRITLIAVALLWCLTSVGVAQRPSTPRKSASSGAVVASTTSPAASHALAKSNGPWLVYLTTFLGSDAPARAAELVDELRSTQRMRAYTFIRPAVANPAGGPRPLRPTYYEKFDQVAVFVGDFLDTENDAQKTLKKIKELKPKCLGADGKTPLRGAILVYNPMIPPAERPAPKPDALIQQMNRGDLNLFACPGKYSLEVASFRGAKQMLQNAKKELPESTRLQEAGEHAEELVRILRKEGHQAYVFHSRQSSMVTVGAFQAIDDPKIEPLRQKLANTRHGTFQLVPAPRPVVVPQK